MPQAHFGLCSHLAPVCDFEIQHGNRVVRVDAPAGSACPLAVIFAERLRILGTSTIGDLAPEVEYRESRDPHYPIEAGFGCKVCRHAVAGPTVD